MKRGCVVTRTDVQLPKTSVIRLHKFKTLVFVKAGRNYGRCLGLEESLTASRSAVEGLLVHHVPSSRGGFQRI